MNIKKYSNLVNKLFNKLKEYKKMKIVVKENSHLLEDGRYKIHMGFKRFAYKENQETLLFLDKYKSHVLRISEKSPKKITTRIREFFDHLNGTTIKNKTSEEGKGTLIMLTQNDDIKIFNFKDKEVMNFISDKNLYKNMKEKHNYFSKHFNIPVLRHDDINQLIIEKNINYKSYYDWNNDEIDMVIDYIFNDYNKYFQQIKENPFETISTTKLRKDFVKNVANRDLVNSINKMLETEKEDLSIPLINGHGDLCFYNILLDNNQIFYIDWEYSGDYIFFYDLYNFIFVESVYRNDFKYLINYLKGQYDDKFIKIYKNFELKFERDKRINYFLIYLMQRMIVLELNINIKNISKIYFDYLELIKFIIEYQQSNNCINDEEG